MKRELLKNVKVMPYTSGDVLHRSGFLSAVLGIKVDSITGNPDACKLILKIEHGDDADGEFVPVEDPMIALGEIPMSDKAGIFTGIPVEEGDTIKLDLDLVGCKEYVKITAEFKHEGGESPKATAVCAIALGDKNFSPV